MNHITKGFGRCQYVSEREAKAIKEYNERTIQTKAAKRHAMRHEIEDFKMTRELGITRKELNHNRLKGQ